MNRLCAILLASFAFLSLRISAQPEEIIAFANYRGDSRFAPQPVTNYKYETVRSLFDQLVMSRGDYRKSSPELVMNNGRRYMAWTDPVKGQIGLEEKAYDACIQLGKDSLNALAMLIAHEITHYYENHDWSRHFINNNQDLEASTQISQLEEGIKLETQADYLGGILALTAGYSAYHILPDMMQKLYDEYGFPEQIPGYPSLSERLKLSENTAARLRKLHSVLETANLLTFIEAHEVANDYYRFLLNEYQSYEAYNNAAVNATLAVLKLMKPEEIPFALPLEMDASSRLEQIDTRLPEDVEKRKQALLKLAEQWLQNAASLSDKEALSHLNLAAVYLIKKSWFDAEYQANKAISIAISNSDAKTASDAQILLGIIAALKGEKEKAYSFFELAKTASPLLAQINQNSLDGNTTFNTNETSEAKGVEQIEEVNLDDFLENPEIDITTQLAAEVYCGKTNFEASRLYMHYANEGEAYAVFQRSGATYDGQTRLNISLGATAADVQQAYGSADAILSLRRGNCLRFDKHNLIFIFNEADTLVSWIVYRTNLNPSR